MEGTASGRKLRGTADQRQTELAVRARLYDAVERCTNFRGKRWETRVVFDVLDRFLVGQRNLHSRIEDVRRIEGFLDECECFQCLLAPHLVQQRRSEAPISMLARKRP